MLWEKLLWYSNDKDDRILEILEQVLRVSIFRYMFSLNYKIKSSNADIKVVFAFFKQLNVDNVDDGADVTVDFPAVTLEDTLNNEITID